MKDLIFEELSPSFKINDIASKIINKITEKLDNTIFDENKNDDTFNTKTIIINMDKPIFGTVNKITSKIICADSFEFLSFKNNFTKLGLGGEFICDRKEINIVGYSIDNEVNTIYLSSILSLELTHAYKESLYNSKELPIVLSKAAAILLDNKCRGEIIVLSKLMIYFGKNVINDNMEMLYQELMKIEDDNIMDFESDVISQFREYLLLYNKIKTYALDDMLCSDIEKIYGKTLPMLMAYVKNGIDYFEINKRKIFSKYMKNRA